jgi:hypothetical protein
LRATNREPRTRSAKSLPNISFIDVKLFILTNIKDTLFASSSRSISIDFSISEYISGEPCADPIPFLFPLFYFLKTILIFYSFSSILILYLGIKSKKNGMTKRPSHLQKYLFLSVF